jgi:hypothetical protein
MVIGAGIQAILRFIFRNLEPIMLVILMGMSNEV